MAPCTKDVLTWKKKTQKQKKEGLSSEEGGTGS